MTTTTKREESRGLYKANYTAFIKNAKKPREIESLYDAALIQRIKLLGGVIEPIFVLPAKFNSPDGRMVVIEGNKRLTSLEELAKDKTYKGSLELKYFIIDEKTALSDTNLAKLILTFGASDKRLESFEAWKLIKSLLDEQESIIKELNPETLKDEKARDNATHIVAEELGYSSTHLHVLRRVFEKNNCQEITDAVRSGLLIVSDAALILTKAKKLGFEPTELLSLLMYEAASKKGTKAGIVNKSLITNFCSGLEDDRKKEIELRDNEERIEREFREQAKLEEEKIRADAANFKPYASVNNDVAISSKEESLEATKLDANADINTVPDASLEDASQPEPTEDLNETGLDIKEMTDALNKHEGTLDDSVKSLTPPEEYEQLLIQLQTMLRLTDKAKIKAKFDEFKPLAEDLIMLLKYP